MNFGVVILAILLVCGTIFGIIMVASANAGNYYDTYGSTTNAATNNSHGIVTNATAPMTGMGGGIALLLAAFLILVAVIFVGKSLLGGGGYSSQRR